MPELAYDLNGKRIFIAGHRGMVGSALVRRLKSEPCELLTADRAVLNLLDQRAVHEWIKDNQPDAGFDA